MESDSEQPTYILGVRGKTVAVSLLLVVVTFLILYFGGNEFSALHGPNRSGGIYIAFNLAGLLSVSLLVDAFLTAGSAFAFILLGLSFVFRGQILLYDSHVVWKRRGNSRNLQYEDLTDAYFGYITTASPPPTTMGVQPQQEMLAFARVVSFYIDNKLFTFRTRKRPGLTEFLEKRIPKKNIDVEDDDNQ